MNINTEVTIDLDEKRRVWSSSSAEINEENFGTPEARAELLSGLSIAAANGALHAYEKVGGPMPTPVDQTFKDRQAKPIGVQ